MKIASLFLASVYGLFLLVIFPTILIRLNEILILPNFSLLIFKIFGIMFILVGGIIWLFCIGLFHFFGKGTPVPINPPIKLVVNRMYQYSRNPMYMSVLMILVGYFLFFGHILLFFYPFIMGLFFNLFVIFYEEPVLRKKFGKNYIEYCKDTPRWIKLFN